jgi:hypothetical protein
MCLVDGSVILVYGRFSFHADFFENAFRFDWYMSTKMYLNYHYPFRKKCLPFLYLKNKPGFTILFFLLPTLPAMREVPLPIPPGLRFPNDIALARFPIGTGNSIGGELDVGNPGF